MAGSPFRLELEDGTPADPPVLHTAVPNWSAGDTIPLGPVRGGLRVVEIRADPAGAQVLVVEPALELPSADGERHGITAPLDRTGTGALADHAANSPGVNAANVANRAVPGPDRPLRGSEPEAEHPRDTAAGR
jgi:hypothetical protein